MTKYIYHLLAILLLVLGYSCTDLKEEILDEEDYTQIVADTSSIDNLVATPYAYLRDIQSRTGVWATMEGCTDEVAWPARGSDWVNTNLQTLFTHDYTATNSYIRNTWNSFMIGITKSNIALYYLAKFNQTDEVKTYIAEVKFIRALCMYMLNDCFGQLTFRESSETDFSKYPQILSRADAIARIESELKEIIPTLKLKSQLPYGRVSKAAAQMLLAKLYLNWNVYTNGSESRWSEVVSLCDEIINSGEYVLADNYWGLFQYDNAAYSFATESILTVIYDETKGLTGANWIPITLHYNQKFGSFTSLWNGCCTTATFVDTWDTNDVRFKYDGLKSTLGFNLGFLTGQQYSPAGVALTTRDNVTPLIFTKDFSISNSKEQQGIRVVKFAPNPSTTNTGSTGTDFHFYRLADTYLMRAEAKFRNGDNSGALTDLNTLRTKRGQAEYTSIDADKILNERGYELYWENSRRNDLVRFGKYCDARQEKETVTPSYKILFPIPSTVLEANSELTQNPGY